MQPIYDVDVIILMAITLSAKRRPAQLVEILAAADLAHGAIPAEGKMLDSFRRLAAHGLLVQIATGFTLTPESEAIMATIPKKAETTDRIYFVKDKLSSYNAKGEFPAITLSIEDIGTAVLAHRAAEHTGGKNLLMPKPKTVELDYKRPQWRPGAPRKRKD